MNLTLSFLKKLAGHNNKEWFDGHKPMFLEAKAEFEAFVDRVIADTRKFDNKISPDLTAKQCVFRIYKDVRFSADKTPYKTNMGASINPGVKKSAPAAGYYCHLEPGNSFIAGGVYMPEPAMLQAIRQEIDYNPAPLLKILTSAPFKKYFGGMSDDDKLKTAPKGFDKAHPHLELLKNKHFLVMHRFSDKEVLDKNFQKNVVSGFKTMLPFLEYFRKAIS